MDREEMGAVLAGGGTVLYKGRHIQTAGELPSEAELALENGTEGAALKEVKAQIAKLNAEAEALEKSMADKKAEKADKLEATKAELKAETKAEHKAEEKEDNKPQRR